MKMLFSFRIREYIIRINLKILLTHKSIKQILIMKTMNEICHDTTIFNSQLMKTHFKLRSYGQSPQLIIK